MSNRAENLKVYTKPIKIKLRRTKMNQKEWLTKMYRVASKYSSSDKYNFIGLFLDIEKCATEYKLSNGEEFCVPLENGAFLKHSFTKSGTDVFYVSPSGQVLTLLDKTIETSPGKMYEALTVFMDKDAGIGEKYSHQFEKDIQNIQEGDIIVSGNKKSYICMESSFNEVKFIGYSSDNYKITDEEDSLIVENRNSKSMQMFFNEIKGSEIGRSNYSVEKSKYVDEKIKQYTKAVKKGATVKIKAGPNTLRVKKSLLGKKNVWLFNNERITETKARAYLALINKAGTEFIYNREKNNDITAFNDDNIKSIVNEAFSSNDFELACKIMQHYCEDSCGELQIDMQTYHDEQAVSYLFRCDETLKDTVIIKLTYEENDFTKDITSSKEVFLKDFVSFCEEKYDETYRFIESKMIEQIKRDYPEYSVEGIKNAIKQKELIKNRIDGEQLFQPIVRELKEDNKTLADSYLRKNKKTEQYERF